MNKKIVLLFFSCILLVLVLNRGYFQKNNNSIFYGIRAEDIDSIVEKMDAREFAGGGETIAIAFNGHPIPYDAEHNVYYVTQNIDSDEWYGNFSAETGTLRWLKDEYFSMRDKAIEEGHVFLLYDFTDDGRWTIYQIVFTGMPVVVLDYGEHNKETGIYYGTMQVYDNSTLLDTYHLLECEFSVRGYTSRAYDKRSYRVELEKKKSLLGMRKDDDWILSALYDDAGLIHNKLSFEVWRDIASSNTVNNDEGVSMKYVELIMDGSYRGVYLLMERLDDKSLGTSSEDIIYKWQFDVDPEIDELSDSYGLENYVEIKYRDTILKKDWNPLRDYVDSFYFKEDQDLDDLERLINLDSIIDYTIFCQLVSGKDNLKKNFYLIAEKQNDGYQIRKSPWDLNETWGNDYTADDEVNRTLWAEENIYRTDLWGQDFATLYEVAPEQMEKLVSKRWRELRDRFLTEEYLCAIASREYSYLYETGGYTRNYKVWNSGMEQWRDEYIYQYIRERIPVLDELFSESNGEELDKWIIGMN